MKICGSFDELYLPFSTNSKSKLCDMSVLKTLREDSANVFPMQTRLPPEKGTYDIGCRFVPAGVSESGLELSNRSGMNSNGFYHWAELWCRPKLLMMTQSKALMV